MRHRRLIILRIVFILAHQRLPLFRQHPLQRVDPLQSADDERQLIRCNFHIGTGLLAFRVVGIRQKPRLARLPKIAIHADLIAHLLRQLVQQLPQTAVARRIFGGQPVCPRFDLRRGLIRISRPVRPGSVECRVAIMSISHRIGLGGKWR